jgi:long-chain acyl-CoA synthetase
MGTLLSAKPKPFPKPTFDPAEQLIELPYTGGTTGESKGVMLTHENLVANYLNFKAALPLEDGQESFVGYMPFYHAAGQSYSVVSSILGGYFLTILTTPDLDDILNLMARHKASFFLGAPTIFEMLKSYEKTDRLNWKSLKVIISGADAMHEHTAKELGRRWGVSIDEGYGLTECVATTHLNPVGKGRLGSFGQPIPGLESAILDPDEDVILPVGETGEIAVCGRQISKGYWKSPEETSKCVVRLGDKLWWRTGDIGRMDEDGYFYFYERKRDLIKYKGLRVFAREVEETLKTHPKIKEVGVVGVRDELVGENVKAAIILENEARGRITAQEIIDFCQGKMASYKIPKIVEFVGELPKTDIGKISRREIREQVNG